MQRFLPFLPPTGGTVDDTLAVEAAGATQEDLEWLLACDGAEFWGVVRADPSLPALVDSYLRYARWGGLMVRHMLSALARVACGRCCQPPVAHRLTPGAPHPQAAIR